MCYSIATARSAPILAWEDERQLIERWQCHRDDRALERLLLSHARLVHFWVRKTGCDQGDRDDLVAEGILGLIKAAEMFDLSRDVRFSTYARWWVKNAVLTGLEQLRTVIDRPAGADAIIQQRSIDQEGAFEHLASDDPTPEERLIDNSKQESLRARVHSALTALDDVDREVVTRRTLQNPPEAIPDLALRLGMNVAKLRQVERRALSRLRNQLALRGAMKGIA